VGDPTADLRNVIRGSKHLARILDKGANALQRSSERLQPSRATNNVEATRVAFDNAVAHALANTGTDQTVSVLAVSVDFFDAVVANRGAAVTHEIQAAMANRLNNIVRPNDVVIADGEDSLAVAWTPAAGGPDASAMAVRIAQQFHQPISTSAGQLAISVSIGVATCTGTACETMSAPTLRRQARAAVRSAQQAGRAQIATFDNADQASALETYETERQLFAAIRNEEIAVRYQPIVSLHSGETVAVEAAAYWNNALLGTVSSATFMPIAEESGLIQQIGSQVLAAATDQANQWNTDGSTRMMTVNVSNAELLNPELLPSIEQLLEQNQLDPQDLCLEISETVVMSDVAASMTILGQLKDLGLTLAIDNFGTGYSSLAYLRRLPVDILKIDRSFVQSIYNRDDRAIARAVIDLAHTLGMTTVADGVETRMQVEVLHALNCDMAQGVYFHSPSAPENVDLRHIDFNAPSPMSPSAPPISPATLARNA